MSKLPETRQFTATGKPVPRQHQHLRPPNCGFSRKISGNLPRTSERQIRILLGTIPGFCSLWPLSRNCGYAFFPFVSLGNGAYHIGNNFYNNADPQPLMNAPKYRSNNDSIWLKIIIISR